MPGRWSEREPFDHLGGEKKTDFFFFFVALRIALLPYFIVLDIFERRGLNGAFCSFLGFNIIFLLHPSLATMEF